MQKKLIALAVAGLVSAPAFAQSNVTIYGIADAYLGFGSHGDNDFQGVGSAGLSGSRIGFKGAEDLGNGLKAVFTIEQGFSIDTGLETTDGNAFQRQAFVGLGGSFGTVSLGRQYAPGYHSSAAYDAFGAAAISPAAILVGAPNASKGVIDGETLAFSGLSIAPNSAARWDNSVAYTGSFSGLTARAIYSFGGVETNKYKYDPIADEVSRSQKPGDDDAFGLGLEYANGPLAVGVTYHQIKNNAADQKEWLVGASYDFSVVKLLASYQQADNTSFVDDLDADLWQVGVVVPVGAAGNVHLGYGEVEYDFEGESSKAKSIGLAYTHAMSKRTTAYVGYNYTDNDDGLTLGAAPVGTADINIDANNKGTVAIEDGEKSKMFVVGVRHTF